MNLTMKWTTAITTMAAGFVATVLITTSADAKSRTCLARMGDCQKRCMAAHDDKVGQQNCEMRTCSHQYQQCYSAESGYPERGPRSGGLNPNREPRAPKAPPSPREPRPKGPKGGVVVR